MSRTHSSNPLSLMSHTPPASNPQSIPVRTAPCTPTTVRTDITVHPPPSHSDTDSSTVRLSSTRGLFIVGHSPTTLLVHIPISALPTLLGQPSSRTFINKQLLPRIRSVYIQYISAAILNPTSDIHWVKFLLLPHLLFCSSQSHLTGRQVLKYLCDDDWQYFLLGSPPLRPSHSSSAHSKHQRCARLVEAGNLSKAYNLHTSSPVTSLLSSQETILLLRDLHPPLHTASFQPHELATFTTPAPLHAPTLPLLNSNDVLHYIKHSKNGIAPGYDKLRMEHLKALTASSKPTRSADEILFLEKFTDLLNLLQSCKVSPTILVAFRSSNIIALNKGPRGKRPIGLQLLIRKMSMALATRSLKLDLQPSFRHLQFGLSSRGTENIIHTIHTLMKAHPEFDIFFADGINAFNSASRVQSRLFQETHCPEACSFIHQFYGGPPSDIWHTLNPLNISSIKSSEGFQQGDPASTLLYCTAIHDFIKDLQRILTSTGPALPLFFVDDGTIIGPHALILRAIQYINDHGPRVGYRLNTAKGKILLGRCSSVHESNTHYQDYCDLSFEPSVIAVHPDNSLDPDAAALSYGSKLLGSYIGSDAFITQALTQYLHQAELQAHQLCVDCPFQTRMLFLRSCFLPKFSHIFRTVPPRLTLHFAQQANSLCYRIFQSMLSYLRIQLSPVHLQQLHLNIDDGGSSLPDMCLIQQCAYCASFTQCLPSILEVLNTISPISTQDILSSYDNYQAPPLPSPLPFYQPHISFRDYFDSVATLHSHHAQLSLTTLLQDYSLKPKLQRFLYGICYERYLQSFQHSLSVLNDPIRTAHYYTLIGKDSSRWQYLIPKFGLYTMSDKDYQSALARRFYLPQPQIPSGLTCSCRRLPHSPIIDQEGRHFTTGCPLRGVRQASSNSIIQRLLYILYYASCRPTLEDRYILRAHDETEGRRPDITLLNAPNYPGPLLIDVSLVQSFPGSQDPSRPLSAREATLYSTILDHPAQRTSASQHNAKNNKYLRVCADNGVSFLPFIVESNGYIHPSAQEFLRDLAHQASFYRSIPSTNLYTFFTSILSVGLQTALSDAILTHSLSLRPPPPLLVTVSDSDIATAHIYT